jgi:phosphate butyryltransferase
MIHNFETLKKQASRLPVRTIVVAMAEDSGILTAIKEAITLNIAQVILTGNKEHIRHLLNELHMDEAQLQLVSAPDEKHAIREAVELIKAGTGHVLMKGLCSTAVFLKEILNKSNDLRDTRVLSHVAMFESSHYPRVFMVSDAAVNIAPDLSTKVAITLNAAAVAHKIGYKRPKVALLSAVEKVNYDAMPSSVDAAVIAKMAERGQLGELIADGPLAIDNALSEEACVIKGIHSPVGGSADILIVPNIETGNVLYKGLTLIGNARVAGILVGTRVPVVLTSRADSEDSKFLSILLALNVSREA